MAAGPRSMSVLHHLSPCTVFGPVQVRGPCRPLITSIHVRFSVRISGPSEDPSLHVLIDRLQVAILILCCFPAHTKIATSGREAHLGKSNPKVKSQESHGQMMHPVQEGPRPNFKAPRMGFASADLGMQSQRRKQCADAWQLVSEVLVRPSHTCTNFCFAQVLATHARACRFTCRLSL